MMVIKITQGVKISVNPVYQPQFSDVSNHKHIFAYTIIIENLTEKVIQLLRREWNIFDSSGNHKQVKGDGIVGEQPILEPGTSHQYVSACSLQSEYGTMKGHYIFNDLAANQEFKVAIPEFQLIADYKLN